MTGSTQISSSSEGKILQVNLLLFSIWLFETPWTVVRQASLSFIVSQGLLKLMPIQLVMPSNHRILCHPLLLLPSVFNLQSELALCIRWPKYWNFNLSISPSNEYSGLIFFRINWFDLLAVQGTLRSLLQHHSSKAFFSAQPFLWSSSHICTWLVETPLLWLYRLLSTKWYLCFLIQCLGLSQLFLQGSSVFYFHGCSHHLQWFLSPRK